MNLAEIKTKHQAQSFLGDAALYCTEQRVYGSGQDPHCGRNQQQWEMWFQAAETLNRLGAEIFSRDRAQPDDEEGETGNCSEETRAMLAQEFFEARRERRQ